MIDRILARANQSKYDFRETACPQDSCRNTWDLWVDYYRIKRAIAAEIDPDSILEIGVRYGYSALAFLNGAPDASYEGWDIDSDDFGGESGAFVWAERKLNLLSYDAEIRIKNSQHQSELTRDYTLVHIDGQQDYIGTLHDLEMCWPRAKYILLDGYHWTPDNWKACQEWLYVRAHCYKWAVLLPGYAGELLINVI